MIGDLPRSHIVEVCGVKVGLLGLCEEEWDELYDERVTEKLVYKDFVEVAKELSHDLKKRGCEYIIALTHLRLPNDRLLAEECQDSVDLILGGHDHSSICEKIGRVTIVKSGTDFEEFSDIEIDLNSGTVDR